MKLKEGEYICDKCNGRGNIPTRNPDVVIKCPKCFGKQKLDWIENVVGVTKLKGKIDVPQEWINFAAKELAKQIDDDILKGMYKETCKTLNGDK